MNHLNKEQLAAYLATDRHKNGRYKRDSYLMDKHMIDCRECAGRLLELIHAEQCEPKSEADRLSSSHRAGPLFEPEHRIDTTGLTGNWEWLRFIAGSIAALGIGLILSMVDRWVGWITSVGLAFMLGAIFNAMMSERRERRPGAR